MPASHGCAGERGGRRPETFRGGSRGPTDGRLRMGGAMGISAAVARRRHFPGKKTWGKSHLAWLASQKIDHLEQRIAFEELMLAMRQARERIERLEQAMRESMSAWSLAPVVEALQAVRGIDIIGAMILLAEIGDLSRFENPSRLMAHLGLTPSGRSTGDSVKRGGITKT